MASAKLFVALSILVLCLSCRTTTKGDNCLRGCWEHRAITEWGPPAVQILSFRGDNEFWSFVTYTNADWEPVSSQVLVVCYGTYELSESSVQVEYFTLPFPGQTIGGNGGEPVTAELKYELLSSGTQLKINGGDESVLLHRRQEVNIAKWIMLYHKISPETGSEGENGGESADQFFFPLP